MDGYWERPKEYNEVTEYDPETDLLARKIDF